MNSRRGLRAGRTGRASRNSTSECAGGRGGRRARGGDRGRRRVKRVTKSPSDEVVDGGGLREATRIEGQGRRGGGRDQEPGYSKVPTKQGDALGRNGVGLRRRRGHRAPEFLARLRRPRPARPWRRTGVMNLTAILDPKEVAAKHYLDCWRVTRLVLADGPARCSTWAPAPGSRGIPIALAEPNSRVTVVDSTRRRSGWTFVDECDPEARPASTPRRRSGRAPRSTSPVQRVDVVHGHDAGEQLGARKRTHPTQGASFPAGPGHAQGQLRGPVKCAPPSARRNASGSSWIPSGSTSYR